MHQELDMPLSTPDGSGDWKVLQDLELTPLGNDGVSLGELAIQSEAMNEDERTSYEVRAASNERTCVGTCSDTCFYTCKGCQTRYRTCEGNC